MCTSGIRRSFCLLRPRGYLRSARQSDRAVCLGQHHAAYRFDVDELAPSREVSDERILCEFAYLGSALGLEKFIWQALGHPVCVKEGAKE